MIHRLSVVIAAAVAGCHPTPTEPVISGRISVAPAVDAKVARTGTLFLYWMTKGDSNQVMSGDRDLTPLRHLIEHLTLVGPVDLSKPVAYTLPVERGDIVVSAVLDSHHDGMGAMLSPVTAAGGDLSGDAPPVEVNGATKLDFTIGDVSKPGAHGGECTGPQHELVELDAPEVAGTLGNETHRRLCVITPASYAAGARRYPVVYELPGWGSDDAHMISEYHHDALFLAAAPETILVLVDTTTRAGSSHLVDSPRSGAWNTYLAQRVIPEIDRRYRTIASRDGRAIAGLSTGGFGALSFGMRHGELIGVIASAAPDGPDITRYLFQTSGRFERGMLKIEAATGGAGFFSSYGSDWSPDDSPRGWALPIDPDTNAPDEAVFAKWRAQGPETWLDDPARLPAIKAAFDGRLCLSIGRQDELGLAGELEAFDAKLTFVKIAHETARAHGGHLEPAVMTNAYRCAAAKLARATD